MQRSSRVDYDAIAPLYDSQPHREKSSDPALAAFLAERSALETALLLDIACGTGNQLVANRAIARNARMVGLDGSLGMLRQARAKSTEIGWVHGESSALPFASSTFDFASCQYALHHFRDKAGMVREAFRVLQTGGRLAIFNMCPHDSLDWLYYDYFPEALARDLADFWPPEAIVAEMTAAGFADVAVDRDHRRHERNLAAFLEGLRRRDRNSQLLTLSGKAYEAGLCRLESELADPSAPRSRADHLCFVTICGDKPLH
jgi:ubiquinone/menaquinone biosynthesis C-methylase UbiE